MTPPSPARNYTLSIILLVAVAGLGIALWRQSEETQRATEENARLRKLTVAQPARTTQASPLDAQANFEDELASPQTETAAPIQPDEDHSAQTPREAAPKLVQTPTGESPAPQSSGLALADTRVNAIEGGVRANLIFKSSQDKPLGLVAIVVRLPADSSASILGIAPTEPAQFSDTSSRVSEDGKFAVFNGAAQTAGDIMFALDLSGDAVADVRGTTGIGPFDLIVSGTQARAAPKK